MGKSAAWWISMFLAVLAIPGCTDAPETSGDGPHPSTGFADLELESAFPIPLGNVSKVRELSDGSVLAADPTAPTLVRMDFAEGTLDTLGRQGEGPEEYQQPDQVFSLPGDSTLMVDLGNLRFTFLGPEGNFVGGMPMTVPDSRGFPYPIAVRFVDAHGRLYYAGSRVREDALPDSVAVVRFDRDSQRHDTLAMVWVPEFVYENRGGRRRMVQEMLRAADAWAVGADGSLAIVRANGYSVDWVLPDGSRVTGPQTPVETFPVSQADRDAAMAAMADNAITSMVTVGNGRQSMSMRRGLPPGGDGPSADDFRWAETLPAFRTSSALVSPGGNLWVERMSPAGLPRTLDVFDGSGQRVGEVPLPPGRQLIDFGAGDVAYLVRKDEVDLRWVERYRILRGGA